MIDKIDDKIYNMATMTQQKYIDAVREHGNNVAASKSLGINESTVRKGIKQAIKRASRNGYAPDYDLTNQVAPGNLVKRVSTNYDGDGVIRQQWVIQEPEKERQLEIIKSVIEDLCSELKPLPLVKLQSRTLSEDLMVNIPIGDAHIGMLAWGEECGADYDLKLAESLHRSAIDMLIEQSPPAKSCTIIDLGDYLHSDNQAGTTSRSGNIMDMDGRYHKVIRCAIRITLYYIQKALESFEFVTYRPEVGNHNDIGAIWMQELLAALYADNPRVTIGNDAGNVFFWSHGECFFMSHHGHEIRGPRLFEIFAKKIMDDNIKTKYRKIYGGHVHHKSFTENAIAEFQTYRTLAGKDAYAASHGYNAGRDITAEVWHKRFGEVSSVRVSVPMIEELD